MSVRQPVGRVTLFLRETTENMCISDTAGRAADPVSTRCQSPGRVGVRRWFLGSSRIRVGNATLGWARNPLFSGRFARLTPLQTCREFASPRRTRVLLLLLEQIERRQHVRSFGSRCPRLAGGDSGSQTSTVICLHEGCSRGLKAQESCTRFHQEPVLVLEPIQPQEQETTSDPEGPESPCFWVNSALIAGHP